MSAPLATIDGLVPPHDLDAEAAVLSAILIDDKSMDAIGFLKHEHFYSEAHRRIYEAAVELRAKSQPVDIVQIATFLKNRERLEQVGGMEYLTQVLGAAPTLALANVEAYGRTIHDKCRVRQMIATCQRAGAQGYMDIGDASEWLSRTAESVGQIAESGANEKRTALVKDAAREAIEAMELARTHGGVVGTSTGFGRLDRITGGMHDSDLTIIAARPGLGKTAFVTNLVVNAVSNLRSTVAIGAAFFSLEMPRKQIAHRMLCAEARVDVSRARNGQLTPADWTRLMSATNHVGPLPIWIDDTPAITLMDVRVIVRMLRSQFDREAKDGKRARRLGLVVIDYLQLMKGRGGANSREQEISEISRGLKAMAKDFGVSVIALSQLNRSVETRSEKNKRPQLSDLRESGAIEQDADNIVFIYRDEKYNQNTTEKNIAELIVSKQRNGPTGTAKVRFDAEYTRFDNLAEVSDADDDS